jgi:hypothetical protein
MRGGNANSDMVATRLSASGRNSAIRAETT